MNLPDIEIVSSQVHEAWMQSKLAQGVTTRKAEDGEELMAPYMDLSERAKELDRGTVRAVYAAIAATAGPLLTFGAAIDALKAGHRVARNGWNGRGMWLSLSCNETREVSTAGFWSPHNAQFASENGGSAKVQPCITMKNAQGHIQMGWTATQSDMLTEDWQIVE